MDLRTRTTVTVPHPPETAFDRAVDSSVMPQILLRSGPSPAVVKVEPIGGGPGVGAVRRVEMSDRSSIEEEVTRLDRPARYGYRWRTRPKPPFGWLIRTAEADWTFAATAAGTSITWLYTFTLTSPFVAPLAVPLLAIFRGWMTAALRRL